MGVLLRRVAAVVTFVDDPESAADWYARLLETVVRREEAVPRVAVGGVDLTFRRAETPGAAAANPVVYWDVTDLDAARARALALGARPRGATSDRADGRRWCRLVDPFGQALGLSEARARPVGPHRFEPFWACLW